MNEEKSGRNYQTSAQVNQKIFWQFECSVFSTTCSYIDATLCRRTSKSILSTNLPIKPVQGGKEAASICERHPSVRTPEKSPLRCRIIRARWQRYHYSYNVGDSEAGNIRAYESNRESHTRYTSGTRTLLSQIHVTWKNICLIKRGAFGNRESSLPSAILHCPLPIRDAIFHWNERTLAVRANKIWLWT